jgi:hypothetical protein
MAPSIFASRRAPAKPERARLALPTRSCVNARALARRRRRPGSPRRPIGRARREPRCDEDPRRHRPGGPRDASIERDADASDASPPTVCLTDAGPPGDGGLITLATPEDVPINVAADPGYVYWESLPKEAGSITGYVWAQPAACPADPPTLLWSGSTNVFLGTLAAGGGAAYFQTLEGFETCPGGGASCSPSLRAGCSTGWTGVLCASSTRPTADVRVPGRDRLGPPRPERGRGKRDGRLHRDLQRAVPRTLAVTGLGVDVILRRLRRQGSVSVTS